MSRAPGNPGLQAREDVKHPLDNPVLASLAGPHAGRALTRGRAARYPVDVSPFCALPGEPDASDWADVAGLLGPRRGGPVSRLAGDPAAGLGRARAWR